MFKRTAIAALILGLTGGANAAMYARCESGNVTVPCEGAAWDVGIDLLYLKNHENNMSMFLDNNLDGYDAPNGYGFRLEGSYHWGTGNDFNVNWSHYSKSEDANIDIIDLPNEEFKSRLDVVNFELGQHLDVGENWDVRVHGGLQYASAKNEFDFTFNANNDDVEYKLRGFGPRVGVDVAYDFGNGFAAFGTGAVSVLHAKGTFDDQFNQVTGSFNQQLTVTTTDKRLGVMYTHGMEQGDLTIRGGYQTQNFINGGQSFFTGNIGQRDLAWCGWFIGAKWVGNA